MAAALTGDDQTIEYAGYHLDVTNQVGAIANITRTVTRIVEARVIPRRLTSGRAVAYNEYHFRFQTYVVRHKGVDDWVRRFRSAITQSGKPFRLSQKGFGDIRVNVGAGGPTDVIWGPFPKEFSFRPVGTNVAAEIQWGVEFAMPECPDAAYAFAALELSTSHEWQVDRAGSTVRRVSGFLQVPVNRRGNTGPAQRLPSDSADTYRDLIAPASTIPPGFARTFGPWRLSEDRTRLDFEVIDSEMGPNVLPGGVVEAKVSDTRASPSKGVMQWTGTITGEYTLARGADPTIALRAFCLVARDRFGGLGFTIGQRAARLGARNDTCAVHPLAFSMAEPDVYGSSTKATFAMTVGWVSPLEFMLAGGQAPGGGAVPNSYLWTPLREAAVSGREGQEGEDWRLWALTLKDTALHPRGYARLVFDVGHDPTATLCAPQDLRRLLPLPVAPPPRPVVPIQPPVVFPIRGAEPFPLGGGGTGEIYPTPPLKPGSNFTPPTPFVPLVPRDTGGGSPAEILLRTFPPPSPQNSWFAYSQAAHIESDTGAVPVRPLPSAAQVRAAGDRLVPAPLGQFDSLSAPATATPAGPPRLADAIGAAAAAGGPTVQLRHTEPLTVVYLRGHAVRAGFPVPEPSLVDVNGQAVVPANRLDRGEGFTQRIYRNAITPLYVANWNLRYYCLGSAGGPPAVPPNPLLTPAGPGAFGGIA